MKPILHTIFTSFLCSNNFVESRRMLSKSLHFLDKCGTIKAFQKDWSNQKC
nr:MAG TPA_asm: 2',3'-cyclic-nucleotide 3'-phosphodiesterase [Caudoviricetes sp.]